MNIKCPTCQAENKTSKSYVLSKKNRDKESNSWDTFYDEEGILHNHNDNIVLMVLECSRGHIFEIEYKRAKPCCGLEEKIIEE